MFHLHFFLSIWNLFSISFIITLTEYKFPEVISNCSIIAAFFANSPKPLCFVKIGIFSVGFSACEMSTSLNSLPTSDDSLCSPHDCLDLMSRTNYASSRASLQIFWRGVKRLTFSWEVWDYSFLSILTAQLSISVLIDRRMPHQESDEFRENLAVIAQIYYFHYNSGWQSPKYDSINCHLLIVEEQIFF